jgi:membrane-bound ClpP family serine protease
VETEVSREFVSPEGLEELRKTRTIKSEEVLIPKGEPGEFTGTEARRLGFVSYLATSRRDAARALELPPEAVEEDLSLVESWQAIRVDLKGPIRADTADGVQRLIEEAIRDRGVNFVCLWIDSPGGSPVDSIRLANFLAKDLSPGKVRTVAYIPAQARSDAAIVALACDQVVMRPDAVLGGSGAHEFSQDEIDRVRETIHKVLAPAKSRSWSLPAAMIDPNLEVFRYTRLGIVEYFSEAEMAEQAAPKAKQGEWRQGERVNVPGAPFRTGGTAAVEYRLAARTVEDFAGLKQLYGLEHDPALVEPGWADFLIEALASPGVAWLLLMIGGAAIYAELHTPGIGIGGFIAAICFLLYFWSNHLGGTAGWLEILLFLAGISCLVFEVFVLPGFGIFGFGGGLLVLASLVLASQTFIIPHNEYQFGRFQISLLVIGAAVVGVIASAAMMNRWLPHAPILRRVMLNPLSDEEQQKLSRSESLVDFQNLVGQEGITTTQLTPGGKARFGDRRMDVIADSELIECNTPIVIVEVHGNRVMVQAVE